MIPVPSRQAYYHAIYAYSSWFFKSLSVTLSHYKGHACPSFPILTSPILFHTRFFVFITSMASASISSDAELMWNVLPAVALPSQSKFLTARDRNGNPMVFGIGTDSVLRVAQEDPQTRLRQLIDLHPKLGLPEGAKTNGFDMLQATDDSIYLSLTYASASEARLLALQPFSPKEVDFTSLQASLPTFRSTRLDQIFSKDVMLVSSFAWI